jgi:hypothetical protein
LPSFHWEKQQMTPTTGRFLHTCHVVGKSQMVSIGGAVWKSQPDPSPWSLPDPRPNGIALLDLSTMEWGSSYDPSGAEYTTPQVVKQYIQNQGRYPSSWSDSTVEDWFKHFKSEVCHHNKAWNPAYIVAGSKATSSHTSDPSATQTGSTDTISPGPSKQHGHSSNSGAIAGGVVGGVLAITCVTVLVWYLRRRAHNKTPMAWHPAVEPTRAELNTESRAHEKYDKAAPGEMNGRGRHELDSGWQGNEFSVHGR